MKFSTFLIENKKLVEGAKRIYSEKGIYSLYKQATRLASRSIVEEIGRRGLYNSNYYMSLIYWYNTGIGHSNALPDPFKIIEIDPNEITYITGRGPFPGKFQWQDIGLISGGDWDQSTEQVSELPTIQAINQRFKENNCWDEIYRGDQKASANSDWCEKVDQLYESITSQGYKRKRELIDDTLQTDSIYSSNRSRGINRFEPIDEVVVDIGRNGQFLFVDGRHRLAIARILGLDRIPVRISARHTQWQRIREAIGNMPQSELPAEVRQYLDHPDVNQLSEQGTETD